MTTKTESASLIFIRSFALGVLLTIAFTYAVHVLGTWTVENYRPDDQTTYTVLLHNKCAVFGDVHTLRPATDVSSMNSGINGTKLGGSFLIFFEGHLLTMLLIALLFGGLVFALRRSTKRTAG